MSFKKVITYNTDTLDNAENATLVAFGNELR
jgi:hypothetical protein